MIQSHFRQSFDEAASADASRDPGDQRGAVTQKSKPAEAVFLHTGWRSGGTWVWSRFRSLESVRAFYEPLSAVLGDLRIADLPALRPERSSGHPPLAAPYYEEYRSFIDERVRGVVNYGKRFSIDRFGVQPDDAFPALEAYLKGLCDRSKEEGQVPVLKFCRSQGRLPWLKRSFPQVMHAVVLRNPASQFASGWLLKQKWNPFFVAAPFRVLGLNQHEPIVKDVIEACGVSMPSAVPASLDQYAAACEQFANTVEGTNAYRAFVAMWILCSLRMVGDGAADLLIDMDRIGEPATYASEMHAQVHERTHLKPDFSGARDLIKESHRRASLIQGIDGRLLRPINASAQKFLLSKIDRSPESPAGIVEVIREKLSLANQISDSWRYYGNSS
jgi:hypothetical protein